MPASGSPVLRMSIMADNMLIAVPISFALKNTQHTTTEMKVSDQQIQEGKSIFNFRHKLFITNNMP